MQRLWLIPMLTGCQYLEEVRVDPSEVTWGGYVYAYLSDAEDAAFLTDLTADYPITDPVVELVDLDDSLLIEGTQPFTDSPGYWRFESAPVGEEIAIRLSGEGMTSTVWRGQVPGGTATWLTGALYAYESVIYDDYFATLDGFGGLSFPSLTDSDSAMLWGEPMSPEDWAGATITVTDGSGAEAPVLALAYDESGALTEAGSGAVDLFLAPNLTPGTVTLSVQAVSGATAETTYPARAGDLLSAVFYALPAEETE